MKSLNQLKKFVYIFMILFSTHQLHAVWNPDDLSIENSKVLDKLSHPDFIDLKNKILDRLKSSWCSEEKARLLLELVVLIQPKICVEIGPFTGSSTLPMLAGLKYLGKGSAYIIDPWSNKETIKGLALEDSNYTWWKEVNMVDAKNQFKDMINHYNFNSLCRVVATTSKRAAPKIHKHIDFLLLDGNFSEQGALLDSKLYLPKVVSGGYILLSNAMITVEGKFTKKNALALIFDQCDFICDVDNSNTLLFRKK